MQGVHQYVPPLTSDDGVGVHLELTSTTTSPLSIDVAESSEMRIQRLVSENPVVIFSRSSCFMCDVMKKLLSNIGVHPTVIQLEDDEMAALGNSPSRLQNDDNGGGEDSSMSSDGGSAWSRSPVLYIGGACVGGLESLVALHLSNSLVPKLAEVGALRNDFLMLA